MSSSSTTKVAADIVIFATGLSPDLHIFSSLANTPNTTAIGEHDDSGKVVPEFVRVAAALPEGVRTDLNSMYR